MMKLTDLDPRWLIDDGRKVGFVFKSPTNGEWWQTCFFEAGRKILTCHDPECYQKDEWCCPHSQTGLARAAGVDPGKVQGCERDCAWAVHGPLDFSVLTIAPSIDGSKGGLWHGFITNGQIVGGIP
ncbi:hypothetical protein [Mesorhizobium sp.]|uniref:hypothetical protein n=1 Tax=Mesorhizobium sp. TaxID=1871066 RepID=UPI00122BCE13|nr:hypothetical protein [Mesorhizobium sp.]TIL30049.1 MAG: hypothetical protein E5Y85_25830 [Mesorhizobium sp.]